MYKIVAAVADPKNQIYELNQDILFLYEIIDQKLDGIIETINSQIYDASTAEQAKATYNKNWFCDLLLSVDGKTKLAILLKKLCEPYGVSSETWNLIAGSSSAMLEQIDILQNKDTFRQSFEG